MSLSTLRSIVPPLKQSLHKGQAGKIAVIGGCEDYTGAPFFAAFSALKLGADLAHVFCTHEAATAIKSYSPEIMVHPVLRSQASLHPSENPESVAEGIARQISAWIPRLTSLVVGPGLGRDPLVQLSARRVVADARSKGLPTVLDGDGIYMVETGPELLQDGSKAPTVLTPNVNEFSRLLRAVLRKEATKDEDPEKRMKQLGQVAEALGGATIIEKGEHDLISDGSTGVIVDVLGSPRRCGGQGDTLAGLTGTFLSWALSALKSGTALDLPPTVAAAYSACLVTRRASSVAFEEHKRAMTTMDLISQIGPVLETFAPAISDDGSDE